MTHINTLAVQPWLIEHPLALTPKMVAMFQHALAGDDGATDQMAALAARTGDAVKAPDGIGLIPIYGVLAPRPNFLSMVFGWPSYQDIAAMLAAAVANPQIKTIVLDVDSPGGSSAGAQEVAKLVREARVTKPIVADANPLAASGAYWVASNATEIVATPSALTGSVGVYSIHTDLSAALEKLGIKKTYIFEGKHKIDGNELAPLSEEAAARQQALVRHSYDAFTLDVARGRGVSQAAVASGYGHGGIVHADDALAFGMVDRVDTLADTLARYSTPGPAPFSSQMVRDISPDDVRAERRWRMEFEQLCYELAIGA